MRPALCSSTRVTAAATTPSSTTVTTDFHRAPLLRCRRARTATRPAWARNRDGIRGRGHRLRRRAGCRRDVRDRRGGRLGARGVRRHVAHQDLEVVERPSRDQQGRRRAAATQRQQQVLRPLLNLPLRDPAPRHLLDCLAGTPDLHPVMGEREVEDVALAPPARRERDTPDGRRGRGGHRARRSAAGPCQLAQRAEPDQDCPGLVEGTTDPVLLADHAVVVDPGLPVVGGQ